MLLAAAVCIAFSSVGEAFDPPNSQQLGAAPVTFETLTLVQQEREKLFPKYLSGRESSIGSKLKESLKYWKPTKTGHEAILVLQNAISRNESKKSKVFSLFSKGDFDELKARLKRQDDYFGNLDKALDAFDTNRELPDFSVYSEYAKKPERPDAFFKTWLDLLQIASQKYSEGAQALKKVFEELESKGWLSEGDKKTVIDYINVLNDINLTMAEALEQTKAYVAFERKCDALREHFQANNDIAVAVILLQIDKGVPFHDWLNDYLQFGPAYSSPKLRPKLEVFYRNALDLFNQITISRIQNMNTLKHIDSAYRTVFLRLQTVGSKAEDYKYLVQQRQLAKNGMTSIIQAYGALAKTIGCKENTSECAAPETKGLMSRVAALVAWVKDNPLESEVLAGEISHALSILQGSGGNVVADVIAFLQNAQSRRLSSDFIRSAIFGDYEILIDPKQTLSPELIALTHFAAALPYLASVPKSLFNQNLAATITGAGAYVTSFAVGGPIPVAVLATIKVLMGLGQVKGEKIAAYYLSSRADTNALMAGFLALGSGSGLQWGLTKAAGIYLGKHGTRLFGNAWTNLREGRANWKAEACKASVAVATGFYAWCREGVASGLLTAGLVYCNNECTLWQHDGTSVGERAESAIELIAENMDLDPNKLTLEAKKPGSSAEYDKMLATLSNNDPTQKQEIEKSLESLFAGKPFLFGGFELMQIMAKAAR